jgi:hypothetical protein
MLYTVVTRARCTLIIYDEHIPEQFMHIWTSHFLIETNIYEESSFRHYKEGILRYR